MPIRKQARRTNTRLVDCVVTEAAATNQVTITLPAGVTLNEVGHITGTVQFSAVDRDHYRVETDKLVQVQIFIPGALGVDNFTVPLGSGGAAFVCFVVSPALLGSASAVVGRFRDSQGPIGADARAADIPINAVTFANCKAQLRATG